MDTQTSFDSLSLTAQTWSIAEVERETGLGKDTLRVWERRYGFPVPLRDAQGERAYPADQLHRLRLIKRLLDAGHRPGKVVPLPTEQLQVLLENKATAGRAVGRKAAPLVVALPHDVKTTWMQWLSEDRADLMRQALQQQIARHGLGSVVDQLVAPLCVLVGEGWLSGELSVYQEHLFSETLQSVLRESIASVNAGTASAQAPRVLLTTTPTEQHGLGLLMAHCHFALESCNTFLLGTSTPLADIALAAQQMEIDVLALSFSAYASRRDVLDSLQQLREQLPQGVAIWVGGAAAQTYARALPEGVVLMRQPGDVAVQVQAWRQRQAG